MGGLPRVRAVLDAKTKKARITLVTHDAAGEVAHEPGAIVRCMDEKLSAVTFKLGSVDTTVYFPMLHFSCAR